MQTIPRLDPELGAIQTPLVQSDHLQPEFMKKIKLNNLLLHK